MIGDPYEEAGQDLPAGEARFTPPEPAKKNKKWAFAGIVFAGLVLGMVVLSNIVRWTSQQGTDTTKATPKPVTMTHQQSETFAQQQSGQATYMKGMDRDKALQTNEDSVLNHGGELASDPYAEMDGVPKKTKAQDDAERGRQTATQASGGRSETPQAKAALERQHRRENDLDSSPVSVDFSDYFDKEKPAATTHAVATSAPASKESTESVVASAPEVHRSPLSDALNAGDEQAESSVRKKDARNPKDDYAFDSSFGKLYRLMESTVIETVLVNRLTGSATGPVITMVTDDLYSQSGVHLLIPKGTRLLGSVSAVGSANQERLFIAFHRMIMPDGYSVSLDKFEGLDVVGQTGLRDLVNHHYVQIFGASLALAAVSATAQIGNYSSYGTYDWGTQMRSGVSESLGQSAQRILERYMNVLPTFTIRERARVKIMLSGDLLLPDTKNHTMDPDL